MEISVGSLEDIGIGAVVVMIEEDGVSMIESERIMGVSEVVFVSLSCKYGKMEECRIALSRAVFRLDALRDFVSLRRLVPFLRLDRRIYVKL